MHGVHRVYALHFNAKHKGIRKSLEQTNHEKICQNDIFNEFTSTALILRGGSLVENAIGEKICKTKDETKIVGSEIINFCGRFQYIYIFGAGNVAQEMLAYLAAEGITCAGVIVSDKRRESAYFEGIKVYEFSEIEYNDNVGIILALGPMNQTKVLESIEKNGTPNLDNIYVQASYIYRKFKKYGKEISCKGYFKDYRDLDNIGCKFNTDKSSVYHNYLNKYDFFLNKLRDKEINVLELGIYEGASIAMWEEYFPKATIYGVDINEKCKAYEGGRKKILIKDLSYEEHIKKLADIAPEIIIDDASHLWSHQIKALYGLFPCLPSGGVYILEDLHTSFYFYTNAHADACVSAYDFLSVMLEVVTSGRAFRTERVSCDFYPLKDEIEYLANQIEMMSFIEGSCVIIKR